MTSPAQRQTADSFGFKWRQSKTFQSPAFRERMRAWLLERYGDVANAPWWSDYQAPKLLDAGCGAGVGALELFGERLRSVHYHGADISDATLAAAAAFSERNIPAAFVMTDLMNLHGTFDVIFSEGVMHHTDSTERALKHLASLLNPGGRFLFYVYKQKSSIREFTDDHIREQLQAMTPEEAWKAIEPLTLLGQRLGAITQEVEVPEIPLLGVPASRMSVQRFIYWHVFKAYFDPTWSFEEMNHVNFDWYAPKNCHRQTPEEVRRWCAEAGLVIERENVQNAGITIISRKPPG